MLLSIPGGELAAAGVTSVGVMPSHRRRGILRQLMRRQLDDVLGRGEPLAILWASEEPIYGRFGYGVATLKAAISADRDRIAFRGEPDSAGRVRLIDAEEAARVLPPIWDRAQADRPGLFARSPEWWQEYRLPDPEHRRRGSGPRFIALLELDGSPEAYSLYRVKESWDEGFPASTLRVIETIATSPARQSARSGASSSASISSPASSRTSWRPTIPLLLAVTESRRLRMRVSDGLWLRILDLERALEARSYAGEGTLVLELTDEFVPGNAGTWTLEAGSAGAKVSRGGDAELRLDIRDLASAYLGGFTFGRLAAAGLVEEFDAWCHRRRRPPLSHPARAVVPAGLLSRKPPLTLSREAALKYGPAVVDPHKAAHDTSLENPTAHCARGLLDGGRRARDHHLPAVRGETRLAAVDRGAADALGDDRRPHGPAFVRRRPRRERCRRLRRSAERLLDGGTERIRRRPGVNEAREPGPPKWFR